MSANTLDPILGSALELERLPVRPGRQWAQHEASLLTSSLERIGAVAEGEGDRLAAQQLLNVAEALGVMVVSLIAYSRGRTPKVASKAPNTNIIVPS
jgi:hypothetical protein